ncbi:hypothetical protein CHLNCDRAFT_135094 [Chlorella variabilis]|uniref:SGNH hydrolase-type esterase domain-containing protein n=1 Tax=Chlorella variabilis TaxID=554065 RepID=E1ZHH8_CHLVA|nr:hypothetical protein CHLNCDRAFT_135094 [Chlorella variabilis]EFN54606.1 hypothetical protein CHLNCDRAFT_135094 [Chlorella variabilis]|eukprot:XP_005846708.1 hypothetical protein CHLNCDRAFT_135094 [Chlorella variabilis]
MRLHGFGILFYGDSIIESLRGTDRCKPCDKEQRRSSCAGVAQLFQRLFGRYRPGVMGMGMDETGHLLWRLQHGEIPARKKARPGGGRWRPRVVVLLIGTNDLTNSGWSATVQSAKEKALAKQEPGIVARILDAVGLMRRKMPGTRVVLLGILPRGTGTGRGLLNAENDFSWPSHYTKSIARINAKLKAFAKRSKGKVVFLDCGRLFIRGRSIDAGLMADAIHPTAAGWGKLAACMLPTIRRLA